MNKPDDPIAALGERSSNADNLGDLDISSHEEEDKEIDKDLVKQFQNSDAFQGDSLAQAEDGGRETEDGVGDNPDNVSELDFNSSDEEDADNEMDFPMQFGDSYDFQNGLAEEEGDGPEDLPRLIFNKHDEEYPTDKQLWRYVGGGWCVQRVAHGIPGYSALCLLSSTE
jgi:hypothetical protein